MEGTWKHPCATRVAERPVHAGGRHRSGLHLNITRHDLVFAPFTLSNAKAAALAVGTRRCLSRGSPCRRSQPRMRNFTSTSSTVEVYGRRVARRAGWL
eukprot:355292-Chlamydomonas_euryale.AAC.4